MSYRDAGFDPFFRRMIPSNNGNMSAVSFDSQQEGDQIIEYSISDQSITKNKIKSINAEKIETSTLRASLNVGDGESINISGPNNNIVVNDGTYDLVLIGKQVGGF